MLWRCCCFHNGQSLLLFVFSACVSKGFWEVLFEQISSTKRSHLVDTLSHLEGFPHFKHAFQACIFEKSRLNINVGIGAITLLANPITSSCSYFTHRWWVGSCSAPHTFRQFPQHLFFGRDKIGNVNLSCRLIYLVDCLNTWSSCFVGNEESDIYEVDLQNFKNTAKSHLFCHYGTWFPFLTFTVNITAKQIVIWKRRSSYLF